MVFNFHLQFTVFLRHLFGSSLSDMNLALRIPLSLAAYLLKNCILMYPLTCFMLLRWDHCYKVRIGTHLMQQCA